MLFGLDQLVVSSFKEFLSYQIQKELRAYRNSALQLYPYTGARKFIGKSVYATNKAQWLYDSSLSGVQVPSGVDNLTRGESGLSFDFKNGRVLVNSGVQLTGQVNVSVPDFNFYITSLSTQKIISESNFNYGPDFNQSIPKPDSIITPCIVVSSVESFNDQEFIGGIEKSTFNIQVVGLSHNLHHLIGLQKVVRDIQNQVFPLLSLTPFNELNDLKAEYWNYTWVQDWLNTQNNLVMVESSKFKFTDIDYVNTSFPNLLVGIGTINLVKCRNFNNLEDSDYTIPYANLSQYIYSNSDKVYIKE